MNLNNIFKKVTGVALAATLSFGAFAGNAFAAAPSGSAEGDPTIPTLTKIVNTGDNGYFGGGEFTFTIAEVELDKGQIYTGYNNQNGGNLLTLADDGIVEVGKGKNPQANLNLIARDLDNDTTTAPGMYRYKITETDPKVSGMTIDERGSLYVDVFVRRTTTDGREIAYYIVHDGTNKTNLTFTNNLTQEDLKITKTITGNQANLSDTFTFTINVDSTNNTSVRYSTTGVENNVEDQAVTTGQDITIAGVKNDSTITLTGLTANDTVTITESDAQDRGYVANVSGGATLENDNVDDDATATATVTTGIADITWENSRTAEIPTGLIENIAPFVLAIAAAGFIFFVYFKRDKEEELA